MQVKHVINDYDCVSYHIIDTGVEMDLLEAPL